MNVVMWPIKHRTLPALLFIAAVTAAALTIFVSESPTYPDVMDSDRNGIITLAEWRYFHLAYVDVDVDGLVSLEEWTNYYLGSMDVSLETWKKAHFSQVDIDRSGVVDITEWLEFHRVFPRFYGGYDQDGYIEKGSDTYYEREFRRVDCNADSLMDWYEYNELRWNLRWCESDLRPERPWWR